jgi:hypothetical protein
MKVLVVSAEALSIPGLEPGDCIRYSSPLKALDNIDEITPDKIIINTIDFPRQWKVIAAFLRFRGLHIPIILNGGPLVKKGKAKKQDNCRICFVNPAQGALKVCRVESLSETGLVLSSVDTPRPGIENGTLLEECSLRIGEQIITPLCRWTENGLDILWLSDDERRCLHDYIT